MPNLMQAPDANSGVLARAAALPPAVSTCQQRREPAGLFARSRTLWEASRSAQVVIAGEPALADPGTLPYGTSAQRKPGKQHYPHMTRIAAPSGDAKGPHPARDPV